MGTDRLEDRVQGGELEKILKKLGCKRNGKRKEERLTNWEAEETQEKERATGEKTALKGKEKENVGVR